MSDVAIRVDGLSKQYRIGGPQARYKTIRESLTEAAQAPFRRLASVIRGQSSVVSNETIWALKDVSFVVQRGEVVGIIGRNGTGKTTLLKVLSRITEPTEGYAEMHGRVGSLLEVGTGFHPELTGRENIYLNGAILGMERKAIERRFDQIVDFSGVSEFLDTPVKHYSSGMYVRLAFSVAAHMDTEILFVDEVLAVGDVAFQQQCLGKMQNVAQSGRTVLFVSHNMAAIAALCTRTILMDQGSIVSSGTPQEVIGSYLERARTCTGIPLSQRQDRRGDGRLRFTDVTTQNSKGETIEYVASGQDIRIALRYVVLDSKPLKNVVTQLAFTGLFGQPLFVCFSRVTKQDIVTLNGDGWIYCDIPNIPLLPGTYSFDVWCKADSYTMADWVTQVGVLRVVEGDFFGTGKLPSPQQGEFLIKHYWRFEPTARS